jgi:two-component system phosphate regulon response regulator OmpR
VEHRVLIIDDDERLSEMVATYLSARGFAAQRRADAAAGLAALGEGLFDALILDVMLPDLDGFEILKRVRADPRGSVSGVPVVMLTARGEASDRIVGLELGADDYLPKPFDPRELLARLRAVLRRSARGGADTALRFGRLTIDPGAREVALDGAVQRLTGHQFDLLLALARRPGRVLTRDQLMEEVRGESLEAFDRSIDVHISRIRAAIEDNPRQPRRILTIRGVGYLFTDNQP